MSSAQDIVNEWTAESDDKQTLSKAKPQLILRWINQGQLRFADKSEMLRGVWQPTVPSSGNISLPVDFLREFADRVKYDVNQLDRYPLKKIDYAVASLMTFGTQSHYSIWNGLLYIWAPAALTPSLPYVKKPAIMTDLTGSLEIPTEFQTSLIDFMDIQFDRRAGKSSYEQFIADRKIFDIEAVDCGIKFRQRNDGLIMMRSGRF